MADFMCPSLHRLGLLLQSAYTRRDTGNNKDTRAIVKAELNLRRIHNLITRHRSTCRRCPFYESRRARTNGTDPDFCGYRLLEYSHLPRLRNPKVVVVGVPVAAENQLEEARPLVEQLESMAQQLMRVVDGLSLETLRQLTRQAESPNRTAEP